MISDKTVLIAGGGPVGVTLALELAQHGVRSVVLEARGELPPSPRCNTTNARSMEIFRRLGAAGAIRQAGLPLDHSNDVVYMTAMNGEVVHRFERPTTAQVLGNTQVGIGADWPTPEPQHFISQLYMEPPLRQHAQSRPEIDLRLGWELLSFTQDASGVQAQVREAASGRTETLQAAYLVGADGSNSRVRRDIGARLEGLSKIGDACTVFIRAPRLTELYQRAPGWMYRFYGGGIVVAIDGVDEWLVHVNPPPGTDPLAFDFEAAMFSAIGERFSYEVINDTRWTARAMVVNKYREGRVFLAGDAAHIWVPMGGFGMNSGVGDALALGWRLGGVVQGWLNEAILDTYETERRPLGAQVASQAVRWIAELSPLLRIPPAARQALRDDPEARRAAGQRLYEVNRHEWESVGMQLGVAYAGSPVIAYEGAEPPAFSVQDYVETSCPGARAPHLWREGQAGRHALFDDFGSAFTLLRIGTHPPSGEALITAAQARGLPLAVVAVPEAEAVHKYQGFGLVLVRPDQYIAWRGQADPADASALLDQVTGATLRPTPVRELQTERLASGLGFPEGLRMRRGKLVLSDMTGRQLLTADPASGAVQPVADVPQQPNGLGYLPDGRLVVASMFDARLYLVEGGALRLYADLSHLVTGYLGDLLVDRSGRIYVGDVGAHVLHGEAPRPGRVLAVEPDGQARVVLEGIRFPNGMAITPDGNTLLLSETMGSRILQSRIAPGGDLKEARPFITLAEDKGGCDGLAIDRNGGLWLCLPKAGALEHYDSAGRLTARVATPHGMPIACALSADDKTLYVVGSSLPPAGTGVFEAIAKRQLEGWLAVCAL